MAGITRGYFGPGDVPDDAAAAEPGKFPYRRGIYRDMYRGKLWTIRQYCGFGGPRQTNERFEKIIAAGGTGLSLAFDLPTQLGLDSDDCLSRGEVGRAGVAIDTVEDMACVFKDIDLSSVSVSMTINAPAAVLMAFYLLAAKREGIPWDDLRGTVQNDILKEYIARGTYIYPPCPSLRLVSDLFAFCTERVPNFNPISVSGYHIREAGASTVQELAFTLANARAYVGRLLERGQDVNSVARRFTFFFSVDNGFLEEVAKFRAARILWALIMRDEFGADKDVAKLRFHCQTAGSTLVAQEPENNAVRVAIQALAAVLGGTQSLHTNAKDEALSLPTEDSARLALQTQHIIAHETNVCSYVDPLGGAYAIEYLTEKYVKETSELLRQIEYHGGMLEAINRGLIKQWIQESSYQYQRGVESGEIKVVGVNCYKPDCELSWPVALLDPEIEQQSVERLRQHRSRRDGRAWADALSACEEMAKAQGNVMPVILSAAEVGATLGEICRALKSVFGEHQPGMNMPL